MLPSVFKGNIQHQEQIYIHHHHQQEEQQQQRPPAASVVSLAYPAHASLLICVYRLPCHLDSVDIAFPSGAESGSSTCGVSGCSTNIV